MSGEQIAVELLFGCGDAVRGEFCAALAGALRRHEYLLFFADGALQRLILRAEYDLLPFILRESGIGGEQVAEVFRKGAPLQEILLYEVDDGL